MSRWFCPGSRATAEAEAALARMSTATAGGGAGTAGASEAAETAAAATTGGGGGGGAAPPCIIPSRQEGDRHFGKPYYISPESHSNRPPGWSAFAHDMWACGVLLAIMLGGRQLWDEASGRDRTFRWVNEHGLRELVKDWALPFSAEAVGLLEGLLQPDPARRLTVQQAMCHEFLNPPLPPAPPPAGV